MKYLVPVALVGVVAVGGYFVYKAISQPTNQTASACSGDWTDYLNPACILGGVASSASNAANTLTNEVNTILIILAIMIILVVGLLAFGPQTQHIARGAGALAVL
jgi:hypothetical protein